MYKNLKKLLPRKLKVFLINSYEDFFSILLLNIGILRRLFVLKELRSLNKNFKKKSSKELDQFLVIIALRDADNRFEFLENESTISTKVIHISRHLYRYVFSFLIKKNGYKSDVSLGEIPIEKYYDKKLLKYRKKYVSYCKKIAFDIKSITKADCFLLPKLNDDWIIDVIKGTKLTNTKIIVHDREYGITKKRMEIYPKHLIPIYDDIKVDLLCLTNSNHSKFFELCGFPKEILKITGNPITDRWYKTSNSLSRKQISPLLSKKKLLIVFFAFGKYNYLNFFYKDEKRNWDELGRDYHDILLELLIKYGNKIQIVYKLGGKPARDTFEDFEKFTLKLKKRNLRKSLIVLNSKTSTTDLLKVSDCVIGFQTLGLIEAMFTKQPIFHGGWGKLYNDIKETLMPLYSSKGLNYFESKNSMLKAISKFIENDNVKNQSEDEKLARKKDIEKMYHIADGKSSKRLIKAIEEYLQDN